MVQSKGKKSSVNFKYYALENWLLSLTSNSLSSTAGHFPAKASLESLGLYGMRCKPCRRGRQEGRVVPLLYYIVLLLSGKLQNGRKMAHPTFGAMRQLPKDLFHLSSVCPLDHGFHRRLPPQLLLPPLQRPTRARYARVRRFSLFAFTSSPYDGKNL